MGGWDEFSTDFLLSFFKSKLKYIVELASHSRRLVYLGKFYFYHHIDHNYHDSYDDRNKISQNKQCADYVSQSRQCILFFI